MGFIHKNPVNAQLLKGDDIILAALVIELFQLLLNAFPAALQLLHGEIVAVIALQLPNAVQNLLFLLLQYELLPFLGHGDFLKLAVPDDDGIVVTGSDSGTEPFPVLGFKVLFGGNQNVGGGVELQIFGSPLLGQMIRHHKQAFLTQPQPLALLSGGYHLERLPSPHRVCQQSVSAIEDVGNGIHLMGPERNFRIDSHKIQMASVIFPWPDTVESLIVERRQPLPAFWISPDPVRKFLFDLFLLSLSNGGLLRIQNSDLPTVSVIRIIENTHIPQIQRFLNDPVGVDALCTKGAVGANVGSVQTFPLDIPFAGIGTVMHLDIPFIDERGAQQFKHEILNDIRGKPCSAQSDSDFSRCQVNGLHRFQRLNIDGVPLVLLGK